MRVFALQNVGAKNRTAGVEGNQCLGSSLPVFALSALHIITGMHRWGIH